MSENVDDLIRAYAALQTLFKPFFRRPIESEEFIVGQVGPFCVGLNL